MVWSRTKPDLDAIEAPIPPEMTAQDIASLVIGGIDYAGWLLAQPHYDEIVTWVLRWFFQRTARYASYQEMVPGQYYRAQVTNQILLLPLQEQIVTP